MGREPRRVVTDTNILINFFHIGRLDLLEALPLYRFVVCDEVYGELTDPDQRRAIDEVLARGHLTRERELTVEALTIYATLRQSLDAGESACLALAESKGLLLASDERGAFSREATARLGKGRLLTTPGILVLAIRAGRLTVEEADEAKRVLEGRRFKMAFTSFADMIRAKGT